MSCVVKRLFSRRPVLLLLKYMERAETLTRLRGDAVSQSHTKSPIKRDKQKLSSGMGWREQAGSSFPTFFFEACTRECTANDPLVLGSRTLPPSVSGGVTLGMSCIGCCSSIFFHLPISCRCTLFSKPQSDLLPRKIELEQHYLEEALQTLTNPQSESYQQILQAIFGRPTPDLIEVTFDIDAAAEANNRGSAGEIVKQGNKRVLSPSEGLIRAIGEIRATKGLDFESLASLAMSSSSLVSATDALRRARNAGRIGKGIMKRSTQRSAGILAMNAATSAAVSGAADGVHGADPRVLETVCAGLRSIFESHGAVHLRTPLMRPRPTNYTPKATGGPAEVMNSRGTVLLLPEDLTAPFARAVGRGGTATSNIKRYDIDRVYQKSLIGGHPRESLEASFDIVREDHQGSGPQLEAEALMIVCQAMALCGSRKGTNMTLILSTHTKCPVTN